MVKNSNSDLGGYDRQGGIKLLISAASCGRTLATPPTTSQPTSGAGCTNTLIGIYVPFSFANGHRQIIINYHQTTYNNLQQMKQCLHLQNKNRKEYINDNPILIKHRFQSSGSRQSVAAQTTRSVAKTVRHLMSPNFGDTADESVVESSEI